MAISDIWAVVPIKEAKYAKQRLAGFVPTNLRPGLVLAMFEDVLEALAASRSLSGIIVVTADDAAAAIARIYDARILADEERSGHTAAVARAAHILAADGCGGMLQVPGDIPLVSEREISLLLQLHKRAPAFTIVPSHDNFGSNAVLVSPPDAVPLVFGDDSFYPHLHAAQERDINPLIVRLPGVGRDIDRPEDIYAFASLGSSTRTQAFLTRSNFASWADPLLNARARGK